MKHKAARTTTKGRAKAIGLAFFILLCGAGVVYSALQIGGILARRTAARQEYDRLRQQAQAVQGAAPDGDTAASESGGLLHMLDINPDFVGWLSIPGTEIDYPVVQGTDNDKYLHTTFEGERSEAGAIFMDCGSAGGFDAGHAILYGHNMKDGTMFAGLAAFLDADYRAEHPTITITLPDGTALTYRIFAARASNVDDAAYRVAFPDESDFEAFAAALGAPEGAGHILTLSTCAGSGEDTDRVLVHAILAE